MRHTRLSSYETSSTNTPRSCGGFENTSQKLLNVDCTPGLSQSSAAVGTAGVGGRAPAASPGCGWSARRRARTAASLGSASGDAPN
eukprot:scaffold38112_cov63-Phaeocystis_antarctica.AAC.3